MAPARTRLGRRSKRRSRHARRRLRPASSTSASPPTRSTSPCPGTPPVRVGHIHPITRTRREIEDIFVGARLPRHGRPRGRARLLQLHRAQPPARPSGADGPGHLLRRPRLAARRRRRPGGLPPGPRDVLLRTHTSPNQVRAMEANEPPLFVIVPGTVYRRDTMDATHLPMFSQVEGLAVAEDITLADLAGTLQEVARALFGDERETRLKPDFFPFTEPSVQVDVSCFRCGGSGTLPSGERDGVCKGTGWIEILGAGMVDPNVFGFVSGARLRPRARPGLRLRHGDRADRLPQARHPRPAHVLRERRALPGAVRMKIPYSWLTGVLRPGHPGRRRSPTSSPCAPSRSSVSRPSARLRPTASSSATSSRPSSIRTPTA